MQKLEVFQSMWAMERRRPDGAEWSLATKIDMISAAGFDGVDIVCGDFGADEILPLLEQHRLAATVTAFPKGLDDLGPAIDLATAVSARHLNIIGQVYPFTVEEGARFVRGWLAQCAAANLPVTMETHRDCLTTDLLYTLQLIEAVPDMMLCADLSHFVVAREFTWPIGDLVEQQIQEILDRSNAFQGRVASREQIQLQIGFPQHRDWVELFEDWWARGFRSWKSRASEDATLNFLCELGPKEYAMTGPDGYELSDRWAEAQTIMARAREIWPGC